MYYTILTTIYANSIQPKNKSTSKISLKVRVRDGAYKLCLLERERERESYYPTLLKSKGLCLFHTLCIHTPFTSCIKCGHFLKCRHLVSTFYTVCTMCAYLKRVILIFQK